MAEVQAEMTIFQGTEVSSVNLTWDSSIRLVMGYKLVKGGEQKMFTQS